MAARRTIPERAVAALREFLELEAAGGVLLVLAALLGLLAANGPLAGWYERLLHLDVVVRAGAIGFHKSLLHVVNDGLMAVFFLLVALELKREVLDGQLSERGQLALPAACAAGGMAVPMAVFWLANRSDAAALRGVAVPAATDIAFALGVLALLGPRVPAGVRLLLTGIAVLDDLGAIVLVALFYTDALSASALASAGVALGGLVLLNLRGVSSVVPYAMLGALMWLAVLESGIHATLAGVLLGLTIPLRDRRDPAASPLVKLEHDLHPTVAYAILPLFAFFNAGVALDGFGPASLGEPVSLGIVLGLTLGKPLGVLAAGGALIAAGRATLPEETSWPQLAGMAWLCGIGFTMSLFIGSLAFGEETPQLAVVSQVGVLAGSALSALAGYAILRAAAPRG